jgi:hypothetical protein
MDRPAAFSDDDAAFMAIRGALADAVAFYSKGTSATPSDRPPLSVSQSIELVELYISLLTNNDNVNASRYIAARTVQTDFFSTLCRCIGQPLLFSPDLTAGFSLQQTFAQLRVTSVQAMNKLIILASESPDSLAAQVAKAVVDCRLIEVYFQLSGNVATLEALRIAVLESLFILTLRLPDTQPTLLHCKGVSALTNTLVLDSSAVVRNVSCCILRELAPRYPVEVAEHNLLASCMKLLATDESADSRTLAAEILEQLIATNQAALQLVHQPNDLLSAVSTQLEREGSAQVYEALCRLLETMTFVAAVSGIGSFFDVLVPLPIIATLLTRGLRLPVRAKAASARAVRFIIEYSPGDRNAGGKILANFQSLSSLLKATMDAHANVNQIPESEQLLHQVLCVELGLCVSLILAQNPLHREQLSRELHSFPMWTTALKNAVISFLNAASLDYFQSIDVVDYSNCQLNALPGVEWGEGNKPRKSSIKHIFVLQEQRFAEQRMFPYRGRPPQPTLDLDARRKVRLTFVLLCFATHLSLSVSNQETPAQVSTPRTAHPQQVGDATSSLGASVPSEISPVRNEASTTPRRSFLRSPRPGSVDSSRVRRVNLTAVEREQMAVAYDIFDSSFKLTLQFAENYNKKRRNESMYVPTPDGFVVRQQRLKNPWAGVVTQTSLRTWGVRDVREGDLFYFAIPFDSLNQYAVETVMEKAKRHIGQCKKNIITTPQTDKTRRWFLHDMTNAVMPRVMSALQELHKMVTDHGESNVRFPVFLFREKEMHLGERAVHPGNLVEVIDQVRFYFSQSPGDLLAGANSENMRHLQERMAEVQRQKFSGDEPAPEYDDEAERYGHGDLSSESEGD